MDGWGADQAYLFLNVLDEIRKRNENILKRNICVFEGAKEISRRGQTPPLSHFNFLSFQLRTGVIPWSHLPNGQTSNCVTHICIRKSCSHRLDSFRFWIWGFYETWRNLSGHSNLIWKIVLLQARRSERKFMKRSRTFIPYWKASRNNNEGSSRLGGVCPFHSCVFVCFIHLVVVAEWIRIQVRTGFLFSDQTCRERLRCKGLFCSTQLQWNYELIWPKGTGKALA